MTGRMRPATLLVAFLIAVVTVAFECLLTLQAVASAEWLRITIRIGQTLLSGLGLLLLVVVASRHARARLPGSPRTLGDALGGAT